MFPTYYKKFTADELRARAGPIPPPDIQLFNILNTCQLLQELGTNTLYLVNTYEINEETRAYLITLGYTITSLVTGIAISW